MHDLSREWLSLYARIGCAGMEAFSSMSPFSVMENYFMCPIMIVRHSLMVNRVSVTMIRAMNRVASYICGPPPYNRTTKLLSLATNRLKNYICVRYIIIFTTMM